MIEDYVYEFCNDLYQNDRECKFCDAYPLTWEEVRDSHNRKRWVLVDEKGNIHDCRIISKLTDEDWE